MAGAFERQAFLIIATLLSIRASYAAGDTVASPGMKSVPAPVSSGTPPSPAPDMRILPSPTPAAAPMAANDDGITDDKLSLRDPFLRPPIEARKLKPKSELESFAVEEFKFIGVLTGPDRMRAMLLSPDGRTHIVAERMKIGQKNGYIRKITTRTVYIREKTLNVLGRAEELDSEIQLLPDSRFKKRDLEMERPKMEDASPAKAAPVPTIGTP